MKTAGLFENNEVMAGINKFLNKFDISIVYKGYIWTNRGSISILTCGPKGYTEGYCNQ